MNPWDVPGGHVWLRSEHLECSLKGHIHAGNPYCAECYPFNTQHNLWHCEHAWQGGVVSGVESYSEQPEALW